MKGIELIASENFVSDQVMQAMGSCLTNKYAEGYPGKRYYGGCEVVDQSETIAIERLKKLFNAEWANVQPHSGAQANAAVFFAVLNPGDTFLGLNLSHGGTLRCERTPAGCSVNRRRSGLPGEPYRSSIRRLPCRLSHAYVCNPSHGNKRNHRQRSISVSHEGLLPPFGRSPPVRYLPLHYIR